MADEPGTGADFAGSETGGPAGANTATTSAVIYYAHGEVVPALAAAAVLGVQVGTRAGLFIGGRTDVKWLRLLMIVMLFVFAVLMFVRTR